jgi:hypothetical protein
MKKEKEEREKGEQKKTKYSKPVLTKHRKLKDITAFSSKS